ncbi:MAG: RHS repeat protein, partial [Saprospiraceae bacterium]|nr:RHS repeat protein [Saprospiraceae bacterium]
GDAAEKANGRAGRIKLQEDGSGGREFFYGKLGEVTKEIRSIFVAKSSLATFVTQYKYDTWNRLQEIVYPDGEVLDYAYSRAGKLLTDAGCQSR